MKFTTLEIYNPRFRKPAAIEFLRYGQTNVELEPTDVNYTAEFRCKLAAKH